MISKIVFITGGERGIGKGIALELAQHGWDVAINYPGSAEAAEAVVNEIEKLGNQAWAFKGDIGYSDQVESMFEQCKTQAGIPDLLVNNAGVQTWAPLLELKEEDWDRTIRTNLKGTFLCTQAVAKMMIADKKPGGIINIGSGSNQFPFPNLVDYTASKGGIEMLTKISAVELGRYDIRVNCVAPGAIELERTIQESPDYAKTWGSVTPLKRVGKPLDIARVVSFLASESADFVSGQTIFVDGGLFSQCIWPYE